MRIRLPLVVVLATVGPVSGCVADEGGGHVAIAIGVSDLDEATNDTAIEAGTEVDRFSSRPAVRIVGGSGERRAALAESLERFHLAGLDLPDLEIRFQPGPTGCDDHLGLFQRRFTPWRILVCSDLDFVIVHELAHAWEAAHLDDVDRAAYLVARGLETWNGPGAAWFDRGIEHAAFIIQQNLRNPTVRPGSEIWQDRVDAFELLTGRVSPVAADLAPDDPASSAAVSGSSDVGVG